MATLTTRPTCGRLVCSSRESSRSNFQIKRFALYLLGTVAIVIWIVLFLTYFGWN